MTPKILRDTQVSDLLSLVLFGLVVIRKRLKSEKLTDDKKFKVVTNLT